MAISLLLKLAIIAAEKFAGRPTRQARVLIIAAEDPPEYTAYLARHINVPLIHYVRELTLQRDRLREHHHRLLDQFRHLRTQVMSRDRRSGAAA